jgi:hypothetical protein
MDTKRILQKGLKDEVRRTILREATSGLTTNSSTRRSDSCFSTGSSD